jgi:putative tryptophan/tyrosine transport system substrate-binding protein
MRRQSRGTLLALLLAAAPAGAAEVAVLKSSDAPGWRPALDALRRATPGHAVTEYDFRNDRSVADGILGQLKGRSVILVAMGPLAAQAARAALPDAPLIYTMVQEPTRLGLTTAPNTTGVTFSIPIKNQLAAFRMVNPRGVRIGVIFNPDNTGKQVEEADKAAGVLRLALVTKPVPTERDIPQAVRSLLSGTDEVDALWIPPDPILLSEESRRFILGESLKANKPVYTFSASLVSEGALCSNGPDFASIGEQAGDLVNRVAGGERGKIEALVPRAELVINRKIATKLKIEIPPDALKAANRVF